ncbi:MAG: hypothetical protein A2Z21_06225 [Candidatus Fraserbacteria bacterium RBG_16_55_9]|uniref:Uncharacterized protein n=1 Tax=Fraserbacteria sp. (strain RBG_16_55_9) TaxID=1817864 RepID=A0A1F5UZI1_FRAXR|nr:MAG: hypothetical protein A2Z21_06225 [Candidatus Fraserbacteria bacterium RBG_16_55_9]
MKPNAKIVGIGVAVLLIAVAYWLGSYLATAQMGMPSAATAQTTEDPMARMAAAMERMAVAMERMGGMNSGSMMGDMMSGMMGGSGMMGQNMQSMMEQMMQDCPHMQGMAGSMMPSQPATPASPLTEAALTRTTMGEGIKVDATFLNPLLKPEEAAGKLVFKIALDTHSGDLMAYDLTKLAVLHTSEGLAVEKSFTWEPQSESSHHRVGLLKLDALAQGKPIIARATEYIELELKGIGMTSLLFKWEEAFLGKTKP